jgi:capsular polysaccharide export protein
LQGHTTPFWNDLAAAVEAGGARVRRINLCLADQLFWRRGGAVNYRGGFRGWGRWLSAYLRREGVTDIVYFADRHPYHRVALKRARGLGVSVHSIEFGYLRPHWLTLERESGGAFSHFPTDPEALGDPPAAARAEPFEHAFPEEAFWDVTFNLLDVLGRPLFPRYWSGRHYAPIPDYLWWLLKLARGGRTAREAAETERAALEGGAPFWLIAMQLESDYQLRDSSPYGGQREVIRQVVGSFAARGAPGERLLFKLHPLDSGRENFPKVIAEEAAAAGLSDRVFCLSGGDLGRLIQRSRGVVTVNSTVGVHALRAGRPVCALAPAVYAMPGLVHQGPLDRFWTAPAPPDPDLVERLVRALLAETQINGSFFNRAGRKAAADAMARRILEGSVGPSSWRPRAAPPRVAALTAAKAARRRGEGDFHIAAGGVSKRCGQEGA